MRREWRDNPFGMRAITAWTCSRSCQIIGALEAGKRVTYSRSAIAHETNSRTDMNLEKWGIPPLHALAEITDRKQQEIGIDEIKQAMNDIDGINTEAIPNGWIGYTKGTTDSPIRSTRVTETATT